MDEKIYEILKFLLDFALEVWFSIDQMPQNDPDKMPQNDPDKMPHSAASDLDLL